MHVDDVNLGIHASRYGTDRPGTLTRTLQGILNNRDTRYCCMILRSYCLLTGVYVVVVTCR